MPPPIIEKDSIKSSIEAVNWHIIDNDNGEQGTVVIPGDTTSDVGIITTTDNTNAWIAALNSRSGFNNYNQTKFVNHDELLNQIKEIKEHIDQQDEEIEGLKKSIKLLIKKYGIKNYNAILRGK